MISKELLSEVLGYDADPLLVVEVRGKDFYSPGINIYELAHMCKEWAFYKGYYLNSGAHLDRENNLFWFSKTAKMNVLSWKIYDDAYTEPEAIFKACQWILDNKDKQ